MRRSRLPPGTRTSASGEFSCPAFWQLRFQARFPPSANRFAARANEAANGRPSPNYRPRLASSGFHDAAAFGARAGLAPFRICLEELQQIRVDLLLMRRRQPVRAAGVVDLLRVFDQPGGLLRRDL